VKARLRKKAVLIPAVVVDPPAWEWLMEGKYTGGPPSASR
jgi:hypothetical protein